MSRRERCVERGTGEPSQSITHAHTNMYTHSHTNYYKLQPDPYNRDSGIRNTNSTAKESHGGPRLRKNGIDKDRQTQLVHLESLQ